MRAVDHPIPARYIGPTMAMNALGFICSGVVLHRVGELSMVADHVP